MKILASIPVEKVRLSPVTFTFRHEIREVEVVRITRWAGNKNRARGHFHYQADIKNHPDLHPEASWTGLSGANYRVNVERSVLNKKWKPPVFPDGKDYVEVSE